MVAQIHQAPWVTTRVQKVDLVRILRETLARSSQCCQRCQQMPFGPSYELARATYSEKVTRNHGHNAGKEGAESSRANREPCYNVMLVPSLQ